MQPVRRALQVVVHLTQCKEGLTLQQLADAMNVPCASMHRLLSVLETEGFVSRHHTSRRYFVGPSALDVGMAAQRPLSIAGWAERSLSDLAHVAGTAVLLTELVGTRAVCTLRCDGDNRVDVQTEAGRPMPLHATAEGRVLVSDMSRPRLSRLLYTTDLTPFRPRTPRSIEEVINHVTLIRKHGYGISYDEFDAGTWSLAAPVRNGAGRVIATIAVASAGVHVGGREGINFLRSQVIRTAAALSAELGGQANPIAATGAGH